MLNEDTTIEVVDAEETTQDEDQTETNDSAKDWKAEALKYKAILDRKAKKAEPAREETKSNDFGYDVKAYLKASGVNASEFDFVKAELKNYGKDVDSLLENDYFKAKLETHRNLQKTQDATPKGKGSNGVPTDSIDYWMSKPIAEVPTEYRRQVVNAKLTQDRSNGKFYNS